SYAEMTYCNFTDCDMAGTVLSETNLTSSDLSAAENLSSARYDSDTVWPDDDMLPEGFDMACRDDLSSLKDDEDVSVEDY
ncbi:MAG: pentapeptide repeat-containing protein, partial [Candidatus Gastranaerophilales bacterium]|nr:pentapeptide repeat-containing protein [Candidatus Gastranaerophilales bacterium]